VRSLPAFRQRLKRHPKAVISPSLKTIFKRAGQDLLNHHTFQVSAALSYYFILALFPGLIVLSTLLSLIPMPDLFGWVLGTMARLLPPQAMQMVYSVLADVLVAHRRAWLSFGMLGMIWVASAAFDALIEALNIAYDLKDDRPFWKTRLIALGLAAVCGGLFISGIALIIVGPRFGRWLELRMDFPHSFAVFWPLLHWTIAILLTVLGVELLYFLAPKVKPRFIDTLPGAVISVGAWFALSSLLGIYFRHVANYSRTYGTLGGLIAFMIWFQWSSLALLVGAEFNSELVKRRKARLEDANHRPEPRDAHALENVA
jgi:membrane protein